MTKHMRIPIVAAMVQFIQPLSAELPMLGEPWLGYFAVANESSFRFLLSTNGEFKILVFNKSGDPIEQYPITLQFLATEALPDGSGSSLVEVEIYAYQKQKIELLASPNSSLSLWNAGVAPLHNGFLFQWSADAAKDLDGRAKLAIKIK